MKIIWNINVNLVNDYICIKIGDKMETERKKFQVHSDMIWWLRSGFKNATIGQYDCVAQRLYE